MLPKGFRRERRVSGKFFLIKTKEKTKKISLDKKLKKKRRNNFQKKVKYFFLKKNRRQNFKKKSEVKKI